MGTKVGVGRSLSHDSSEAGREAAGCACARLGGEAASLAVVFATAGYDQEQLLAGVAEVVDAPLVGCSAEGIITQHGSDECSHAVAVMVLASDEMVVRTYGVEGFDVDSRDAGRRLAELAAADATADSALFLFADGIRGNCRDLIAAVEEGLPCSPLIAGGTAGDLLTFQQTYQYHDGRVLRGGVAAVLLRGEFSVELAVSHGCDLIGREQRVTQAEGGYVLEIDDQPAWSVFRSYLAEDADTLEAMHVAHLLLAERIEGDEEQGLGDFTVRVPVQLDRDRGALYFAAGLTEGSRVQLALRNAEKVRQRAVDTVRALVGRRPGREPLLVLQLDCAGRGRLLFDEGTTKQLIEPVQQVIGKHVPWIGLHTYGEIAPVGKQTHFHNYTGVICALYAGSGTEESL